MSLQCDIVTQERTVFSGEVDSVSLPGSEGRMGILPNHAPLLTALGYGEIITYKDGKEEYFAVGGGFVEIQPTKVVILADTAEQADEIDEARAQQARERAEEAMKGGVQDNPARYSQIQASLYRARIRVDVSRKRAKRRTMPGVKTYEE